MKTRTEPAMEGATSRLPAIQGVIQFQRVTFRYHPEAGEVIKNMTFTVPAGKVIGIVGRSGSGKSTISKLVQRLYLPESGKILIDGTDIALADPAWLRRQIGVVLQENFLFKGSIRDNIALQNPATSALDYESERVIQQNLWEICKGRTK